MSKVSTFIYFKKCVLVFLLNLNVGYCGWKTIFIIIYQAEKNSEKIDKK